MTKEILIYDNKMAKKSKGLFDIATPQECADAFKQIVYDGKTRKYYLPKGE